MINNNKTNQNEKISQNTQRDDVNKNSNVTKEEVVNMENFICFVLGIVVGCGATIYYLKYKNKEFQKSEKIVKKLSYNEQKLDEYINKYLIGFSNIVLTYYLNNIAREQDFSISILKKIQDKYGKRSTKPNLYMTDSKELFKINATVEDLKVKLVEYLKNKDYTDIQISDDMDVIIDKVQNVIYKEQEKKAKEIIEKDYKI